MLDRFFSRLPDMTSDPRATYKARVIEVLADLKQENAHWTDVTIAEKLGVSKSAVGQWRKADAVPNPQTLFCLADLAGVSPRWLAMGEGPKVAPVQMQTMPAELLALAAKIGSLPPSVLETLRKTFGEHTPDERVEVFYPPAPTAKSAKKHR
jgi:transcriptional regulator with XRE-family HTH domain